MTFARRRSLPALFLLAGALLLAGLGSALGQTAQTADRFATVWRISGELTAVGAGGERTLREGDAIAVGERVRAAATGEAVLRTADAGYVAVRAGAVFIPEKIAAEGKSSDSLTLRLVSGGLRVLTGWIGRLNRAGHRVVTPSATIGIRGTDHEPYVISAELAASLSQKEGTYDKVNRGGTTMDVNGNALDIDAGKVGFVRTAKPFKSRALMTLLLPVLLDKVPDFYVPGRFDAELDQLADGLDAESQRRLEERRQKEEPVPAAPAAPAAAPAPAPAAPPPAASPAAPAPTAAACDAAGPAREWLARLDDAVLRRDARSIINLFAHDVAVKANVRGSDGSLKSLEFTREELAQSTLDTVLALQDFRQRRPVIEGRPAEGAKGCERIVVRSVAIEQGLQAGKPYRFESLEEYILERRDGRWLAIRAETTQR